MRGKKMISREYNITEFGEVLYNGKNIVTKGGKYPMVCINAKQYYVHRLVAEKYIPNPTSLKEVNHIDGNKHNNNIDNLEWISSSDNTKHGWDNGLLKPDGLVKARRKLSPEQVVEIRKRYKPRCKINGTRALSREFNISQAQISFIVNNKQRIKYEHI